MAATAQDKEIAELKATVEKLERTIDRPGAIKGAPNIVKGGRSTSRGFSLMKAIAAKRGWLEPDQAKEELEACRVFKKALQETGQLPNVLEHDSIMIPLGTALLAADTVAHEGFHVIKSMMDAGVAGYDPDEANWIQRRMVKAQSAFQDSIGGEFVAPPAMGEIIDLMRPNQAVLNAGATQVPLPPQGRIVFPRQSSPSTMYWIGENTSITESTVGTGQIALQAKKGGVYLIFPNELIKYASVAAEGLFRTDIAKTLALGVDYAALYGPGGGIQPKGLVNYTDTNQVIDYMAIAAPVAPKGVGANGNTLRPEDGYRMVGLIEDRSFEFKGWVFRPTMANNITGYRADSVVVQDAAGSFVQSIMRAIGDKQDGLMWDGYKVTKSATVRANQTKGTGTALTEVFGGQWEHLLVGMYGAVEIATSNQTGNTFQQDQTAIRGLIHCDVVPRYEGAFVWAKQLLNTVN